MDTISRSLFRPAFVALLSLSAVHGFAQAQDSSATNADTSQPPWKWVGRTGATHFGHNRYVNTASMRQEGSYVKYSLAIEAVLGRSTPELRDVTLDCAARTRVETEPAEGFRVEDMKAISFGSVHAKEARLVCKEMSQRTSPK